MERAVISREEAQTVLNRIRELIKAGYTNGQISSMTGRTRGGIHHIRVGRRRPIDSTYGLPKAALTLESLGVVRMAGGVKCPRCVERRYLIAQSGLCLECEVSSLEKKGLVRLENKEPHSDSYLRPSR